MDYNSIVFREFTPESLHRIERYRQEEAERLASDRLQRQIIREDDSELYNSMKISPTYEQFSSKRKPNKELAVGQTLPRALQTKFPAELIGKPIEEIDWYYRTEYVFVVVNRNKTIFRFSSTPACFIFSPFSCLRRLAIRILTHALFSTFVMLTILTNCIFMTLKNVPETNEYVFTIIYTLEALTKCVARGFILKKFTFLRDPWNWLDFIVITLAYITFFVNLGNVSVLRTFRVLRALKTVAVVPGLKTIVDALIQSLICLRDVTVLSSFILSIFALVGLQLYMGVLRQKCVPTHDSFLNNSNFSMIGFNMSYDAYTKEIDNEIYWYKEDDAYVLCGNASGSRKCPKGYVCWKDRGENPDFGYTSFDSYGWAMLSCFRLMTQDYWENLYQLVLTAAGRYHFFYFVAVIFFGSFYLVNLILAIVSMSYQEQQQKVNAENQERERRKVEDELEQQQNEEARKACEFDNLFQYEDQNIQNALFFENPNRQLSYSSLSIEYDQNRTNYDYEQKASMQPLPLLVFENSSYLLLNQTTNTDEDQSYDTTIPFLDEIQRNSMSSKSHETSSKQRPRNWSHISERPNADNQSTVTLYQPKTHIKYSHVSEVLPRPRSETTSIRSKKQHTVLYKVDHHIDDRHSSHVECRLLLNTNEHARQLQHHHKKRLNIVISDMDTKNTCDRPAMKFLWNACCEWNFPSHLFQKFQATFKGWIEIMADATDAKEIDIQPEYETNVYTLIYFVLFIIFGSFFTLNLFIGVVIDNFNHQKRKLRTDGSIEMFMTEDQKKYYNAMKKMGNKKPTKALPRPRFALARFLFDLTTNQKFDIFIMICIFLNMLCMCLEHDNQSHTYDLVLGYMNNFFVAIFTIECVMKLVALNFKYFTIPWNVFDFIIVIASILGQTLGEIMAKFFVHPTLLRVVRVARVGRILRLVKGAKGIRTLLFALVVSMPALLNIGLLLFLVMFIYSIFGMSFFAYVRKSAGITDLFNFETFPNSMIVLFQMCTTAGWSGVFQALTNDRPPDCDPTINTPSNKGDCGDTAIATPFIVSYVIITSLVVVNMYIAVILENFCQAHEDVQQGLTDDDYDMYYEKWQHLDPSGSQFIRYDQLSDFVDGLEPPLRISKPNHLALVAMNLPICEHDRMHCVDILDGLTKYFLGALHAQVARTEADVPIDIKNDRPKDYHPITTTVQRHRELYLSRMGLKGFRTNVERRYNERQNREKIFQEAITDELMKSDDFKIPT
ncbi:unnamed protein product [Rotaria sp. Silwood2]|nr:unnamed protein product [Rotaria sp. Silwood2]